MVVKEYRVWRWNDKMKDQRASQGHYVMADNRDEAIDSVRRKGERRDEFGVIVWKQGKDWLSMKQTAKARCFIVTGDIHCKPGRK